MIKRRIYKKWFAWYPLRFGNEWVWLKFLWRTPDDEGGYFYSSSNPWE